MQFHRTWWALLFVFSTVLLASCDETAGGGGGLETFPAGEPTGAAAQALIGPEGGTLASADGSLTLTVPPGAVDGPVEFRVQEITRTAPHGDARAFRLAPHGQTFAVPVTVAFALRPEDQGPAAASLRPAYQDESGAFYVLRDADVDVGAGTLSFETTHFSDWTYLEAFALVAEASSVNVGESLSLTVQSCLYEDVEFGDVVLGALVRTCRPFALPSVIANASVNGVVGGDLGVGTVSQNGAVLTYNAPLVVPSGNPVAISAEIAFPGAPDKLLVIANVAVVDGDRYYGTTTFDGGDLTVVANLTWTASENFDGVIAYVPSGTVTLSYAGCTITPDTAAIGADDGYLEIDSTFSPAHYYGSGVTTWDATMSCPGADPVPYLASAQWWTSGLSEQANADATLLEGTSNYWTWSFSR